MNLVLAVSLPSIHLQWVRTKFCWLGIRICSSGMFQWATLWKYINKRVGQVQSGHHHHGNNFFVYYLKSPFWVNLECNKNIFIKNISHVNVLILLPVLSLCDMSRDKTTCPAHTDDITIGLYLNKPLNLLMTLSN